jgi:hypothetical protein
MFIYLLIYSFICPIHPGWGDCVKAHPAVLITSLGKGSFSRCNSLESVTFESGSPLGRIEESAFSKSGLKSILIPSSVTVVGKRTFGRCKSLESATFESGSRLEQIEESESS